MSEDMRAALATLAAGDTAGAPHAFAAALDAGASPAQIGAFLALSARFVTDPFFLAAGARAMRARMRRVEAPAGAMDVCGTGGDGAHTLNVSTAVSFIVAACGQPVAKHGNRAASSRSGAADVLGALGVNMAASPARCFEAAGLAFLFAPAFHPALGNLAGPRREIGFRTAFNVLGPLANPAGVRRQLLGVAAPELVRPVAAALAELGCDSAWVIHGAGGLDEASPEGETRVAAVKDGTIEEFAFTPEDAGLAPAPLAGLRGGDPEENAAAMRALLSGEGAHAFRTAVLLNAAAALVVAGRAPTLADGAEQARTALASGAAATVLDKLVEAAKETPQ